MSVPQAELLDFLRNVQPTAAAVKAGLKRTLQQFVVEQGWWYEQVKLTEGICRGPEQQCLSNAMQLMIDGDSLVYCEGFALYQNGSVPVLHAWVTDGQGHAIDNTWRSPGVAYAGVPFKSLYVTMAALASRASISLLDDWQNGYPLRRELGDRHEVWLELVGKGVKRLREAGPINNA